MTLLHPPQLSQIYCSASRAAERCPPRAIQQAARRALAPIMYNTSSSPARRTNPFSLLDFFTCVHLSRLLTLNKYKSNFRRQTFSYNISAAVFFISSRPQGIWPLVTLLLLLILEQSDFLSFDVCGSPTGQLCSDVISPISLLLYFPFHHTHSLTRESPPSRKVTPQNFLCRPYRDDGTIFEGWCTIPHSWYSYILFFVRQLHQSECQCETEILLYNRVSYGLNNSRKSQIFLLLYLIYSYIN